MQTRKIIWLVPIGDTVYKWRWQKIEALENDKDFRVMNPVRSGIICLTEAVDQGYTHAWIYESSKLEVKHLIKLDDRTKQQKSLSNDYRY